jgi:L,D-transpeptidase catalytic domain
MESLVHSAFAGGLCLWGMFRSLVPLPTHFLAMSLYRLLITAVLGLLGLVSCVQDPYAMRRMGETMYLEGITVFPEPSRPSAATLPDTFSYWEGGGSGAPLIRLSLSEQASYFYRGGHIIGRSKISSGDAAHPTPQGRFKVFLKDADHKSSVYGWMIDRNGTVVNDNADVRVDKIPPGGKFDPAKMTWFLNFYPAIGMHAGFLPGYPASHGCVRMPEWMAKHYFENAPVGTPVIVEP